MATGKELLRLTQCGIFDKHVKKSPYYIHHQMYDSNGLPIKDEEAKDKVFCHLRIRFHKFPKEALVILKDFLTVVASTRSEFMGSQLNTVYGFQDLVIS